MGQARGDRDLELEGALEAVAVVAGWVARVWGQGESVYAQTAVIE